VAFGSLSGPGFSSAWGSRLGGQFHTLIGRSFGTDCQDGRNDCDSSRRRRADRAAPVVLCGTIVLSVLAMWINLRYFPITVQIQIAIASSIVGSMIGMILRRSVTALVVLIMFLTSLFVWGTATGISDDLDRSARAVGLHVLERADEISRGDQGFTELVQIAFNFAADNSRGGDAVEANKAAILALGVILGEVTLRGRNDLTRHFWLSAALAVLSDQGRSMDVGIAKELIDATPGGSGFSFVDLTADRGGTLFAGVATKSPQSAARFQARVKLGIEIADFFPEVDDLPEGLTRYEFRTKFGGLGGTETRRITAEIQSRLAKCNLLELDE